MAPNYFASSSTITLQQEVDNIQTMGDIVPIINAGGFTLINVLMAANDTMNAMCATAFPWKWNEFNLPVFYTNSLQQDYSVVNPPGLSGNLPLGSITGIANGVAVYNGNIFGGTNNAFAGLPFVVTGFKNASNNGVFLCTQSTGSSLTLKNSAAIAEVTQASCISAASSVNNLSWLERGIVVDINNTAIPKPYRLVEVGRQLSQATATLFQSQTGDPLFLVNWFPNYMLYYGVWGVGNTGLGDLSTGDGSMGNNPVAGSVYTQPLGVGSQPQNPNTLIQDANGNLLLLTTYGTEGTAAPLAPVNATPGTTVSGLGATTVWTVLDPQGYGFRISPVPSQTGVVWQFLLTGQMKPVRFSNLSQTLAPLPDEMEPHFRQGLLAQMYKYSPVKSVRDKFPVEWASWLKSLSDMRVKNDRELEENRFVPQRGIMGSARGRNQWKGGGWPWNYPGVAGF